MNHLPLIALDGPSGVGKSTTAKRVALELGWNYLDTGAMFRATALALHRAGITLEDGSRLQLLLDGLRIEQRGTREFLDGEDVSEAIRRPDITRMVSSVSADARVRQMLLEQQRAIGSRGSWVVDGRDIGTVVFPNACCKIFLTASVDARARRRFLELRNKGNATPLEEVAQDLERRDHQDTTRAIAPLRKAPDATELDSSNMSLEEVVAWIVRNHRAHA
ncbi:(d)CMP kinase [Holophaga foetida]|uniref:(d)CMP kinase n=1 Tax=Holophaga foetida TaxID=35839 RepID=UPI001B7F9668|nr:(d)CMP kinase [Holophaga foetida]